MFGIIYVMDSEGAVPGGIQIEVHLLMWSHL